MILITVGSSGYNFDRLFRIVDELCERNIIDGKSIIAQTGNLNYTIKNYSAFNFASPEKMQTFFDDADVIICHGGTGTIIKSLKLNKKVIVFPRLKKFKEHVDDHQLDIAKSFLNENYILVAYNSDELEDKILNIDTFIPKKFVSNLDNFKKVISKIVNIDVKDDME